ncbi:MAG: hypothetical protein IJC88_04720 [Oscillospiraceae bacterium]|nr:hypothetical protein [Oscillospiraceae bacterium]
MYCENCGAKLPENGSKCPFCETNTNVATEAVTQTQNPFLGKEYNFSGNDLVIKGRWGVRYKVTVAEDRLHFETVPAKKNKLPVIILEDILAIEESFHMRTVNILLGIFGLVLGCAGGYWGFVLPVFVLLCYRERKLKIHVRNGKILTIYSDDKESVREFIEDLKKITNIKQ